MTWATGQASEDSLSADCDDESALAELRWHWGLAYQINVTAGTWTALRRTGSSPLAAGSAGELRRQMRADYLASSTARSPMADVEADGCQRPEPGLGERALRRLLDDGII